MPRYLKEKTYIARELRRNSTPAERVLWEYLRNRKLLGVKFRRQHVLGPYIVDFYSFEAQLVIEVDGAHHFPPPRYDRRRDAWLKSGGLAILRFPNHQVLDNTEQVLEDIRRYLLQALPWL